VGSTTTGTPAVPAAPVVQAPSQFVRPPDALQLTDQQKADLVTGYAPMLMHWLETYESQRRKPCDSWKSLSEYLAQKGAGGEHFQRMSLFYQNPLAVVHWPISPKEYQDKGDLFASYVVLCDYEVDTKGGWVVLGSGDHRKVTPQEFAALPKIGIHPPGTNPTGTVAGGIARAKELLKTGDLAKGKEGCELLWKCSRAAGSDTEAASLICQFYSAADKAKPGSPGNPLPSGFSDEGKQMRQWIEQTLLHFATSDNLAEMQTIFWHDEECRAKYHEKRREWGGTPVAATDPEAKASEQSRRDAFNERMAKSRPGWDPNRARPGVAGSGNVLEQLDDPRQALRALSALIARPPKTLEPELRDKLLTLAMTESKNRPTQTMALDALDRCADVESLPALESALKDLRPGIAASRLDLLVKRLKGKPAETASEEKPATAKESPIRQELARERTWSDKTGKFKIQGTFRERSGDDITLQRSDNKSLITVPLSKLSEEDQALLKKLEEEGK